MLKSLREQRNHHYLMAITRKKTDFGSLDKDLQLFCDCLTPYAFKFVKDQLQASSHVNVLNQQDDNEFTLSAAKNVQEPHKATPLSCDCSFFTSMGLPCKHIFKVRHVLNIQAFSKTLVHERWTMDYYQGVERFPSTILDHHEQRDCPSSTEDETSGSYRVTALPNQESQIFKTLSQAQKFRKGLQIAQTMASLLSEGGMATFRARYDVLQSIVKSWQLDHEVIVGEVGSHGKSAPSEGEAMVDECPATNIEISKKVNVGEKMENAESG